MTNQLNTQRPPMGFDELFENPATQYDATVEQAGIGEYTLRDPNAAVIHEQIKDMQAARAEERSNRAAEKKSDNRHRSFRMLGVVAIVGAGVFVADNLFGWGQSGHSALDTPVQKNYSAVITAIRQTKTVTIGEADTQLNIDELKNYAMPGDFTDDSDILTGTLQLQLPLDAVTLSLMPAGNSKDARQAAEATVNVDDVKVNLIHSDKPRDEEGWWHHGLYGTGLPDDKTTRLQNVLSDAQQIDTAECGKVLGEKALVAPLIAYYVKGEIQSTKSLLQNTPSVQEAYSDLINGPIGVRFVNNDGNPISANTEQVLTTLPKPVTQSQLGANITGDKNNACTVTQSTVNNEKSIESQNQVLLIRS